ncbi:hypothetical protein EBS80_05580, partial [bacterium]|nr:hypothetical protein [bacterium]
TNQVQLLGPGTINAKGNVVLSVCASHTAPLLLTGGADQTIEATGGADCYDGDVTVNKSGGTVSLTTGALTLNAASQDLLIQSGTFSLNGFGLTVNGTSGTVVVQNGGTLQLQGGETVTLNASNPTFQAGSTAKYVGTVGPYALKAWTYKSLVIAGGASSVFSLPGTLSLGENLTITTGILSLTGNTFTVTGTVSNDGTLRLQGGETVTLTNDSDSGIVEYVGNANASANSYTLKNWTYYDLLVNFADTDDTVTASSSPLAVNRNFSLVFGGFTAPTTMNVAGNFSHSGGTFAHNNGTVNTATLDNVRLAAALSGLWFLQFRCQ